jgi:hypothetical protein
MWSWWRRRGRLSRRRGKESRKCCQVYGLTFNIGREGIKTSKETPGRVVFPLIPLLFYHLPDHFASSSNPLISPSPPKSGMSSSDRQSTQVKLSHQPPEHESWSSVQYNAFESNPEQGPCIDIAHGTSLANRYWEGNVWMLHLGKPIRNTSAAWL